jgi:PKD repeat protein
MLLLSCAIAAGFPLGTASSAAARAGSFVAHVKPTPTKVAGFVTSTAAVRVDGEVSSTVTVTPKAVRSLTLQYRRAGKAKFLTAAAGRTSPGGAYEARLQPPSTGTWQYRLAVAKTPHAAAYVTKTRTVKAAGSAVVTKLAGFVTTPATVNVGAVVNTSIVIAPKAIRTVEVQTRGPGTSAFVASSSGRSTSAGVFKVDLRPASAGAWQFRLVVRASATARSATSGAQTVTAVAPPVPTTPAPPVVTPPAPAITPPVASLHPSGSAGSTARTSVGEYLRLDASGSNVGSGSALVVATLNFGDGTTPEAFAGPVEDWFPGHWYETTGEMTATLTVFNAAGGTATSTVHVSVYPELTVSLVLVAPAQVGQVTTFSLAAVTPPGTTFTSFDLFFGDGTEWYGTTPPSSVTHTYTSPGRYDVWIELSNDADGYAYVDLGTQVSGPATQAVLTTDPSGVVGEQLWFYVNDSYAGPGKTLVAGSLDFGDGTVVDLSGTDWLWRLGHFYDQPATKAVTLTVTDSLHGISSVSVSVEVVIAPAASIPVTHGPAHVNVR